MPSLLYLFMFCNVVIGTGAFVITGILAPIGDSLGVTVGTAGQAMTVYALSTAVLAPIALVATGRWPRRRALVFGMSVFALGNVLCALAPDFATLLVGRGLMGIGAMFVPVAAGITVALVEPARRGRALSLVFLGISLSYVIGLPLGTWLGLRFGWQWPLALVAAVAVAAALALWVAVPRQIAAPGANFKGLPQLMSHPQVLLILGLTLLYFVAVFLVFSYIGSVLHALHPMTSNRISVTLAVLGLSGVVGTLLGGWASDQLGPRRSLVAQLAVLGSMMAVLPFTQGNYALILATLVVWGIAGFGMMAPQQARLAMFAPAQAPVLLSLNTSMLYLGTAIAAALGGALAAKVGFAQIAWVGVPFVIAGLGTLWASARHRTVLAAALQA
jgi:DHA1 family inner membrane transport protein